MHLHSLLRDLRFATMSLRRSPGFTLIAVITLGLGIGANTSAFSLVNEILLRPLPYREIPRLERIYRATEQNSRGGVSPADYTDLVDRAAAYGELAGYAYTDMNLSRPGEPAELATGARVSANLLSTLGVMPQLGRDFRREEETLGEHRVVILSHRYWRTRFGQDPAIIGRTIRVDGEPHAVIGVMPASINDWRHLGPVDLYRPLALTPMERADRTSPWMRIVARRSTSTTPEQGATLIADVGRRLATEHPAVHSGTTWRTMHIQDSVAPENGPAILAMVLGLSAFVMLIACSNLANLLLSRTMVRAREFAVRSALGASRTRLLRPLFLESLMLALAGGAAAILVARWAARWLATVTLDDNGEGLLVALDWSVLGWALGACLFTAVVFGMAPALFALRLDLNGALKAGSRGTTGGRGHQRFRHALIVGQFALAMILLAGAALLVRGVEDLNDRRVGWESGGVISGSVLLPAATYRDSIAITAFQRRALERLEAIPGVASASISYTMPFFGLVEQRKYLVAGRDAPEAGREPTALINGVSPGYFETIRTPVLSGRTFTDRDELGSPRVFVINEAMARSLFPNESPIGKRIAEAGRSVVEWGEIVGVVADIQSVYPDRVPVTWQLYQPIAQASRHLNQIAVRTTGGANASVVEAMRAAMATIDPDLPVRDLQSAEATIEKANAQFGILGSMLSFLGMLGLGLAALGIYGVVSRTVTQRTGEFGIRLALGAVAGDIARLVLVSGSKLAIIGAGIGLVGAFGIARLIDALFPNMQANSVPVLAGVTGLLVGIALVACYLPARRAARTSPTEALRAL